MRWACDICGAHGSSQLVECPQCTSPLDVSAPVGEAGSETVELPEGSEVLSGDDDLDSAE